MEKIAYVVIAVETDDWNCENSDVKAVFLSAKELMEYMEHLTRPSGIAYDLGWHQYDYVIQVVSYKGCPWRARGTTNVPNDLEIPCERASGSSFEEHVLHFPLWSMG